MNKIDNIKYLRSLIVDEENFIKVAAVEFNRSESTIRTGWLIRGYFPTREEKLVIPFMQNFINRESTDKKIQEYLRLKKKDKVPMIGKKVMPYWKWKEL